MMGRALQDSAARFLGGTQSPPRFGTISRLPTYSQVSLITRSELAPCEGEAYAVLHLTPR